MSNEAAGWTRRNLFGLSIDAVTMSQAVARCREAIDHGEQLSIGVLNAAKIVSMRRNPELRAAVAGSDMILADGQAVVWASRLLGEPLPERVAGIDLFTELLAEAERTGDRVYFLGARPEVLATVVTEVGRRFPGLLVAGAHDGYYPAGAEGEIAEDIRRSRTDMLFLGMSSPRKELFLDEWGPATKAHVVHGVGGSFDIMAGVTKRAPLLAPGARPGMAVPRLAGTGPAGPPVPDHQHGVHHPGWPGDAAPGPDRGARVTTVVVVGLGYVGLPLAMRAAAVGHQVIGYDVDEARVKLLAAGESYIEDVPAAELQQVLDSGQFQPSTDGRACAGFDVAVVAAPTPLRDGLPDLTYLEDAARTLARYLRPGATVVIESTSYPGHHPGNGAAAAGRGVRPARRAGLPPRLQPGTHRPGEHHLDAGQHAEDRVRDRRRFAAGDQGVLRHDRGPDRAGLLTARGRAGQAGREHVPARQHRAGERAGHVRP